jgi:membrane-bound lytic murein transglycosylase D
MKWRKPFPRVLCCASIVALSMAGCSHNSGKLKSQTDLSENVPSDAFSSFKNSKAFHSPRSSLRLKGLAGAGVKPGAYENLWDRLFDLYHLPPVEHGDIDQELSWFISHPAYIERVQQRAEPFLYSIVRQFEKHDIPGELALLPVIESAFQARAVSPANAAGIWQFIPGTGKNYGLKKSRSYDGRRDIYASTRAAIRYLKKLHGDFNGDWLLAVAAYNCGEGAVAKAIQRNEMRNLPTDFWSLDLPSETRSYVPRLLAVARLFANSDQYGVDLRPIPNQPLFKTVKISSQLDLALAAEAADLSLDRMLELNPGFRHKVADVDGSYRLFVPAHKYREFKEQLPRLTEASAGSAPGPAVVDEGDDADLVATAAEPSSAEVESKPVLAQAARPERQARLEPRRAETSLERPERYHGRELAMAQREIPNARAAAAAVAKSMQRVHEVLPAEPIDGTGKKSAYMVQSGDTLFSIARRNGVDMDQLKRLNRLPGSGEVKAGQNLVMWNKDAAKKLVPVASGIRASQSIRYTVRQGDSISGISKRFNVSLAELRKWNGPKVDKQFKPGVNLSVSAGD